jgi:hypothetical protein
VKTTRRIVGHTWDGQPIGGDEQVIFDLELGEKDLLVRCDAPFHGDPAPKGPAGTLDGLWEFEVVELFLLGMSERYLEIELGPHGHHLVLRLRGPRGVEASGLPLDYTCEIRGARWTGRARVPRTDLPPGLHACNAYAMHGRGARRRYLAAHAVGGAAPDFHRLDGFEPLGW